ncbi:MAG: sugar-binding protein [Clostridiales bacterium]|nr:sugar-binding protein [Clostridiales bacterium]
MCKRFISLILTAALVLSLGLCACGKSEETTKKKKKVKKTTKTEVIDTDETDDTDIPGDPSDPSDPSDPTDKTDPTDDPFSQPDPTGTPGGGNGQKIGISMPTKLLRRWDEDGKNLKRQLEEDGYTVDLQYADNDVSIQNSQIGSMINSGCKVLVIAPIDGFSLGNVVDEAYAQNIPVIAYDRQIMNTEGVTYYASFDNYMAGLIQGEYIRSQLDLDYSDGPYNLEIFAGDPGDYNALFFYQGAIDVLKPYIDSGKLVVRSGQIDFYDVAIGGWRTETAQDRMDSIISMKYSDGTTLDAVLCSNDSTALGVTNSLAATYVGSYPIITGQDCDLANVKNIINGLQSMSVFKDTRSLVDRTAIMVDEILSGSQVTINDTSTYNNGKKDVPSYLVAPVFADKNNYKEVLIDSGYYTEDQLS